MTQRVKKVGKYPIYLRAIKNRKVSYVSTNLSVYLKEWDKAKGSDWLVSMSMMVLE